MTSFTAKTPDGAFLQGYRSGKGQPLVLVSGLGGTAAFWKPASDALGAGFEVICFDQRGIGSSTRGTLPVTIAQLAEDVMTICDALDIREASFLGHSTGGCIVQNIAGSAANRVKRIALSATWFRPSQYMSALFEFRLKLLALDPRAYAESAALLSYPPEWLETNWNIFQRASDAQIPDTISKDIIAERIRALLSFDGIDILGRIQAPTMILGAQDDVIVPAFLQRDLAAHMPQASLHILEDGGHFYPTARTERFAALVNDWMLLK